MKLSRRVATLMLALLIIFTAIPMTAIMATAAEPAVEVESAVTETSQTVPSTLPNGKKWEGISLIPDSQNLIADFAEAAKNPKKVGETNWSVKVSDGVTELLKTNADGIIFRIDTTNAAAETYDYQDMTFCVRLIFTLKGTEYRTYLVATPQQAMMLGQATATANESSTWYYSQDGATWSSVSVKGDETTPYVRLTTGRQVTYVYVPMDAFWVACGESFLKTGVGNKAETILNWEQAKTMLPEKWSLTITNFYGGGYADGNTPFGDENVKLDQWELVAVAEDVSDEAPTTLPDGKTYASIPFLTDTCDSITAGAHSVWQGDVFHPTVSEGTGVFEGSYGKG